MKYYDAVKEIDVNNVVLDELKELLNCDVEDINTTNKFGTTALHLACQEGIPGAVYEILKKKPDIYLKDRHKDTVAHRLLTHAFAKSNQSRSQDYAKCLALLLQYEAKKNPGSITSKLLEEKDKFLDGVKTRIEMKSRDEACKNICKELNTVISEHLSNLKSGAYKTLSYSSIMSKTYGQSIAPDQIDSDKNVTDGNSWFSINSSLNFFLGKFKGLGFFDAKNTEETESLLNHSTEKLKKD